VEELLVKQKTNEEAYSKVPIKRCAILPRRKETKKEEKLLQGR